MANLTTFSFSQIVSNIATAVQGSATALFDFTVGSVLRAIAEAVSGVVLWLQAIILQLLTVTRASTSVGSDLDSWMADYSVTRLPAIASTGLVTFARFTPSQQAVVPVGATVQSADGTQIFSVTEDTTNAAYNAGLTGYVLLAGTSSIQVPVEDTVAGTAGNVQAATITTITTPVSGVDTVTNAAGFINGEDAETDAALRARFVLYLASLSKATKTAVGYAISSLQQGLNYTITEDQDYGGGTDDGFFYVVVDDGSGYPPSPLLSAVATAIESVRALGIRYAVFAPTVETANVAMTIVTAASFTHSNVAAAVDVAIQDFINALPLGTGLPFTQLASIAYGIAGVVNVTGVTLNSGTTDLSATNQQVIKAETVTVS